MEESYEWGDEGSREKPNLGDCWALKRKRPIECKWVFTITYKANGTLERYKARLVVKGYTQTYGADFLGIDLHPCSENEYNWCVIIFGS